MKGHLVRRVVAPVRLTIPPGKVKETVQLQLCVALPRLAVAISGKPLHHLQRLLDSLARLIGIPQEVASN